MEAVLRVSGLGLTLPLQCCHCAQGQRLLLDTDASFTVFLAHGKYSESSSLKPALHTSTHITAVSLTHVPHTRSSLPLPTRSRSASARTHSSCWCGWWMSSGECFSGSWGRAAQQATGKPRHKGVVGFLASSERGSFLLYYVAL